MKLSAKYVPIVAKSCSFIPLARCQLMCFVDEQSAMAYSIRCKRSLKHVLSISVTFLFSLKQIVFQRCKPLLAWHNRLAITFKNCLLLTAVICIWQPYGHAITSIIAMIWQPKYCKRWGLSLDVMLPLTDETARKIHELSPREAQTGPAIRYDENIIEAQMQLMNDNPNARKIYELMAKSIHEKSKK